MLGVLDNDGWFRPFCAAERGASPDNIMGVPRLLVRANCRLEVVNRQIKAPAGLLMSPDEFDSFTAAHWRHMYATAGIVDG
jgi:hypothetical protein